MSEAAKKLAIAFHETLGPTYNPKIVENLESALDGYADEIVSRINEQPEVQPYVGFLTFASGMGWSGDFNISDVQGALARNNIPFDPRRGVPYVVAEKQLPDGELKDRIRQALRDG